MIFYIIFILITSILVYVTIAGKDAFPFSHYPMFSGAHSLENAKVFRLALEKQDGEIVWWNSEFYRYPEFVGRQLKRIYQTTGEDKISNAFVLLERQKLLIEVLRIIAIQEGTLKNYKALHIVERSPFQTNGEIVIDDRTISVMPFEKITREFNF